MRDIEFRAKVKGDAGVYKVWGINWLDQKMLIQRACGDEWVSFDKIQSLMQFTGLVDKNEIRIYEGDIVKHQLNNAAMEGNKTYSSEEVIFDNGAFRNKRGFLISDYGYNQVGNQLYQAEVIGNIWEHSSLLDKKSQM